nr:hypothetical protein [Gordonia sp. KTR9]
MRIQEWFEPVGENVSNYDRRPHALRNIAFGYAAGYPSEVGGTAGDHFAENVVGTCHGVRFDHFGYTPKVSTKMIGVRLPRFNGDERRDSVPEQGRYAVQASVAEDPHCLEASQTRLDRAPRDR